VVLRNLDALLEAGIRVKINAVALRGHTGRDMPLFLDLIRNRPVDMRFIEFMPMGSDTRWSTEQFLSADELLAEARKLAEITPLDPAGAPDRKPAGTSREGRQNSPHDGPARMYAVQGSLGRFGLITPMSNHFCAECNRLRVTSDGRLRTCLFADKEYRLRGILRRPRLGDAFTDRVLCAANRVKPLGADILRRRGDAAVAAKAMRRIGG
jgi:cyclic pyranopterin phosphate synthase